MVKNDGFNKVIEQIKQEREQIKEYEIEKGPEKFELMMALFVKETIAQFAIEESGKSKIIQVQINSIQAEDGSRESWNITGGVIASTIPFIKPAGTIAMSIPLNKVDWKNFKGYYSTLHGKGQIKF